MKLRIILLCSLLIICTILGSALSSIKPISRNLALDSDSSKVVLGMLGELRYTLAAFIWLKADYYHHEYELNGKRWEQNKALMSLIRLVTILDPHFTQAYDFGAYHLGFNLNHYDEAYAFLEEGLRNNPDSFELNWEKAYLLYTQKKYTEALPFFLKALREFNRKSYMDQSLDKKLWVLSRLTGCYMELKDWDNAYSYCRQWLAVNPESPIPKEKLEIIQKERGKKPGNLETKN
jgi:tetratricopeptide (TPR) repeat protein